MPNTEVNPGSFNFEDAPGGELRLDDIFTDESNAASLNQQTVDTQTVVSEPETFLKTTTGTVYKTADDAVKGIEHKDALIADLRNQLSKQTGVDPITHKTEQQGPVNYLENPEQYFQDIAEAKDKAKLVQVQAKFVNDNLAPYAPLLSSMVKSQAVEKTVSDIPTFTDFQKSQEYEQTLEQFPLIKQSIQIAESNPNMVNDLVQLYKMAYEVSAGRNVSKIVKENRGNPQTLTRPTVSSTPISPGTQRTVAPTLATSEGRKSIIAAYEEKGIRDFPL